MYWVICRIVDIGVVVFCWGFCARVVWVEDWGFGVVWGWGVGCLWGWGVVVCVCYAWYPGYTESKFQIQLIIRTKELIRDRSNRLHNVLNVNNPTHHPKLILPNIPSPSILPSPNILHVDRLITTKIRIKWKIPTNIR